MRLTLSREVSLAVLASARTQADHHEDLGCSILGPPSRTVRRAHSWLKRQVRQLGPNEAARQARALVKALEETKAYAALCEGAKRKGGRRVLREGVLFPRAERWKPTVLHVRREQLGFDLPVSPGAWPIINEFFACLAAGASPAEQRAFLRAGATRELFQNLRSAGWLEPFQAEATAAPVTFVGHNTTVLRGQRASVLVDPYFRPASAFDLPSYQPMQPRDLGPIDAVLITHSHGDHFHLGSLLQLPPSTRFFVPPVERESLFSTDCALRLRQLGFRHVEALPWGSTRQVGDVQIEALPFYGEQPTFEDGLYPKLRNIGSTWVVRGPNVSAAFFADSGEDSRGSMEAVAQHSKPVDLLFCGVRGFHLKPIFMSFTTLDSYLVNVPLKSLTVPQQLMADAKQALRYAHLLQAKLVPCADGGAPWYWREGMGPKYPGFPGEPVDGASPYEENPDADPYPERVLEYASRKSQVLLLRPGESVNSTRRRPQAEPPFQWPFALPANQTPS